VVEDLFIVALGDSFASGESNPDKPVQFSASREMVYDPTLVRDQVAARTPAKGAMCRTMGWPRAKTSSTPKVLPRRYMDDEAAERFYKLNSPNFVAASTRPPRAGSAATATARNTVILSASRSSLRSRTAIAR